MKVVEFRLSAKPDGPVLFTRPLRDFARLPVVGDVLYNEVATHDGGTLGLRWAVDGVVLVITRDIPPGEPSAVVLIRSMDPDIPPPDDNVGEVVTG